MIRTGQLRPCVSRELAFDEIPAALEQMEQRKTMGRLVVLVDH
jgi:NADPH:quinone reductase-like Zn-dependent oxidoreductase